MRGGHVDSPLQLTMQAANPDTSDQDTVGSFSSQDVSQSPPCSPEANQYDFQMFPKKSLVLPVPTECKDNA